MGGMLPDNTNQLSDKAKELLIATANENSGGQIEFFATSTQLGRVGFRIFIGSQFFGSPHLEHITYLEYREAADELVENDLATDKSSFSKEDECEYVYELTSQGYRTAGLIGRVGL